MATLLNSEDGVPLRLYYGSVGRWRLTYRAMRRAAILLALGLLPAMASAAEPTGVAAFIQHHRLTRYQVALADLNGDTRPEALVYAMATSGGNGGRADLCGSGGCNLYVLSLTRSGYRLVTTITLAQPPVRVLRSVSHGWRDLGVRVAGGGISNGFEARLRFDGKRYPSNPTAPAAVRAKGQMGETVIGALPVEQLPPQKRQ